MATATTLTPPSYPGDSHLRIPGQQPLSSSASLSDDVPHVSIHHGADPSSTDVLTLSLPADFPLSVPPHYHMRATEWMKVLEGEVHGVVNGKELVMRAGEDWLEVPPYTVHSFEKRKGGRTVWLERASDAEGKRKFFQECFGRRELPGFLGAMALFYRDGDTLPSMPGAPYTNVFGYLLVNVVGRLADLAGLDKSIEDRKEK
ncbi:hypothetical protein MMC30_004505 [Trapelia coarctata]|nr:hypothetical protein [Trapelia coarctata]